MAAVALQLNCTERAQTISGVGNATGKSTVQLLPSWPVERGGLHASIEQTFVGLVSPEDRPGLPASVFLHGLDDA